jgi:hypothetical protein
MALLHLEYELDDRAGSALMPGRWPMESLVSWCREVAKHNASELEPCEESDLFDVVNSFIEKLLLAQDVDRYNFYRKNRDSLFDLLAHEVDGIVRDELVARLIGYGIDRTSLREVFRAHFPNHDGPDGLARQVDQSSPTTVHTGPI